MVGSRDQRNKKSSLLHDESLEMDIIRNLKSLGCSSYEKLCLEEAWVQTFGNASDSMNSIFSGRYGKFQRSGQDEFGDDGMRT